MKFRNINVHNIEELVPRWAIEPFALAKKLEEMFSTPEGQELLPRGQEVFRSLPFWIEVDVHLEHPSIRVCVPDEDADNSGTLLVMCSSALHGRAQLHLPLNAIFKGYPAIAGSYSVYVHAFQTDTPLPYIGMTKQRWFDRYAQHLNAAKSGSHLLFHQALRTHQDVGMLHRVYMCELSHDLALEQEEDMVRMFGLYPLGLNMIPGGKAGFEYLGRLGYEARTAEQRDALAESLTERESLSGRPNPLCAARWASDPDFVERVVCGHSGRLTAEQIAMIRQQASLGRSTVEIAENVSARNLRQVANVLSGRTYARIRD